MNLRIGSGDTGHLLAGKNTKGYLALWQKFVADNPPYYNAKSSPIDALRIGAILEDRYYLSLPDGFYPQWKVTCAEMDVLGASLDFAKLDGGKVVDFEELKTISFNDFIDIIQPLADDPDAVKVIKTKFSKYYNQVQQQLLCANLESASLVFLPVYNYIDEDNYSREVSQDEVVKFRISRDTEVIDLIKERAIPFQVVKDSICNSTP